MALPHQNSLKKSKDVLDIKMYILYKDFDVIIIIIKLHAASNIDLLPVSECLTTSKSSCLSEMVIRVNRCSICNE